MGQIMITIENKIKKNNTFKQAQPWSNNDHNS